MVYYFQELYGILTGNTSCSFTVAIYIVFMLQLDLNHWRKDYVLACSLSTAQQVEHKMKRASKLLGAQETDRQTDND